MRSGIPPIQNRLEFSNSDNFTPDQFDSLVSLSGAKHLEHIKVYVQENTFQSLQDRFIYLPSLQSLHVLRILRLIDINQASKVNFSTFLWLVLSWQNQCPYRPPWFFKREPGTGNCWATSFHHLSDVIFSLFKFDALLSAGSGNTCTFVKMVPLFA